MAEQDPLETEDLLTRIERGEEEALARLFSLYRERLRRLVGFRLDPRVRGRLDASDVVQDTYVEAAKRLRHFVRGSEHSFFVWLRMLALQRLVDVHRQHLGAKMRDAGREAPFGNDMTDATSASIARELAASWTSPSEMIAREEARRRLEAALGKMEPLDREVIALRHFEELTNAETAAALGIEAAAASKRYVRALRRLKDILSRLSTFSSGEDR